MSANKSSSFWREEHLGRFIARVVGGGTPSRAVASYWVGSIPWASVKDFRDDVQILESTEESISQEGLLSSAASLIDSGTVIVCTRMAVGRAAIAGCSIAINQDLKALYPTLDLQTKYLLHLLTFVRPELEAISVGSTVKGLSLDQLLSLNINLPPLPEQRRIAAILDAADEAIAASEALIAKLKAARQGLLHDLLTRGIDANGQLRDPAAHPEQFKETELGLVPREWEVCSLSQVVPSAEYGISVSLDDEQGIPVLRMNNFKNGEANLIDLKRSTSAEAARLLLRPLDVLFNRTNSIDHVGRTGIWRGQIEKASFASYLVRLLPDLSQITPEYLNLWLNLLNTQQVMRRYATPGVHQVNINPTNLRKITISLPAQLQEQQLIVNAVSAHDARVAAEEAARDKLVLHKQGLMHDLLTGRVRTVEL